MATRLESKDGGKALRQQVPRSSQGAWTPGPDRPDPFDLEGLGRRVHSG